MNYTDYTDKQINRTNRVGPELGSSLGAAGTRRLCSAPPLKVRVK
jgi:hypothetical protein